MDERPQVTIGIPCLNEEHFIERCVRDALSQDYPADRIEVILADGGSTDRTRTILTALAAEDPRVLWLDNPGRIQACGMNEIIRVARGDLIVRFDAHCEYAHDYVRRCVEVTRRTGADNVGGAQRAKAQTSFQRSLCAALESVLAVGGAAYRSPNREGYVDTLFCGAFRRRVFEQVGLYDPRAITNEDAELNQRILAAGGKIYLSREIVAHYYPRKSYQELARQYFRYGQGRARTLLKHRKLVTVRPLIPFFTVVGGASLLVVAPKAVVTWSAFGAYALLIGIEAHRVARRHPEARAKTICGILPVLHVSHGVGVLTGLARYLARPDWGPAERLEPPGATSGSPDRGAT
jgi:glycosyltransferase involved in cell wall biosynthesis